MSVASKNLFAVLGDDVEEPVAATPKADVVRKSTSSKKSDEAPAKANAKPSRKPQPTGNEAALKDKNVGRQVNRSKGDDSVKPSPAAVAAARKSTGPARPDRHSQTGKTDTEKKVTKGWGDNRKKLQDEAAGETIAKEDAVDAADESEAAGNVEIDEVDNTKTLDEYFAELNTQNASLNNISRSARKPNDGADDKWKNASELKHEDETAQLLEASKAKTLRQKNRKEKQILEANLTFASPRSERSERPERSGRGGSERGGSSRGGSSRGGRGGSERGGNYNNSNPRRSARPGPPRSSAPAVNILNKDEFPTLGA